MSRKEYLRKVWFVRVTAVLIVIGSTLVLAVCVYGIVSALFFPENWIATLFFNDPLYALIFFVPLAVGLPCVITWFAYRTLALKSNFMKEMTIYFNALEYSDYARVFSRMMQPPPVGTDGVPTYYVAFDLASGQRKSFTLDAMQYNALVEGEVGILSYKQNGEHLFYGQFSPQRAVH